MITHLRGTLTRNATTLTVDIGGIGYEVIVTDPDQFAPEDGKWEVAPPPGSGFSTILVRQIITETSNTFYGFPDEESREIFDMLTKYVSGIGPKTAHNIVGKVTPSRFKQAVAENDLASLSAIKGIGAKTAERIMVELRDKVQVADLWGKSETSDAIMQETILALISLGLKRPAAEKAAKDARKANPDTKDTQALTRAALKQ